MSTALTTISPGLFYRDAPAAIEWLGRAFGFDAVLVVPGEAGEVAHAELKLGDAFVMLSSEMPDRRYESPSGGTSIHQYVNIATADVKPLYDRAVAAGATVVHPYEAKDYGGHGFTVRDPEGHEWSVGSYQPGGYQG
ncbi:MAG: VOC family protein [Dehalococcoidia bacterium]